MVSSLSRDCQFEVGISHLSNSLYTVWKKQKTINSRICLMLIFRIFAKLFSTKNVRRTFYLLSFYQLSFLFLCAIIRELKENAKLIL